MTDKHTRAAEHRKYVDIYARMPNYRMGDVRFEDAKQDIRQLVNNDLSGTTDTLLDVGCGRGEILDFAEACGFRRVNGIEVVPELCDGVRVKHGVLPDLPIPNAAFNHVTCFDVLEHLPPGDETPALLELARCATDTVIVTANNRPSVDPDTGANLHINIKSYETWEKIMQDLFGAHRVQRIQKRYVSATWWIYLTR